jgi:hypothetical protein
VSATFFPPLVTLACDYAGACPEHAEGAANGSFFTAYLRLVLPSSLNSCDVSFP